MDLSLSKYKYYILTAILLIAAVTYYYFIFSYVHTIQKTCDLSKKNKDFGDFYVYYLVIAPLLLVGISLYKNNVLNNIFIKNPKATFFGKLFMNIGMFVLIYFLYEYIQESQKKCKLDKTLHEFGEVLNVFNIISGVVSALGLVMTIPTIYKMVTITQKGYKKL